MTSYSMWGITKQPYFYSAGKFQLSRRALKKEHEILEYI